MPEAFRGLCTVMRGGFPRVEASIVEDSTAYGFCCIVADTHAGFSIGRDVLLDTCITFAGLSIYGVYLPLRRLVGVVGYLGTEESGSATRGRGAVRSTWAGDCMIHGRVCLTLPSARTTGAEIVLGLDPGRSV